jgi:hypothetical protein
MFVSLCVEPRHVSHRPPSRRTAAEPNFPKRRSRIVATPSAEAITAESEFGVPSAGPEDEREGESRSDWLGNPPSVRRWGAGSVLCITKCPPTRNLGCLPALIVAWKRESDE